MNRCAVGHSHPTHGEKEGDDIGQSTMGWVVCVLLLLATTAHATLEPDLKLLFEDGGYRRIASVFTQTMRFRQALNMTYGPAALQLPSASLAFVSRGRHVLLKNMPSDSLLALHLGNANGLWARWRYAHLTNVSLRLTNTAPQLNPMVSVARLPCRRNATIGLCHVPGLVSVRDAGNRSHVLGQYELVVDPDRWPSSLPPALYFLLTNGRARWRRLPNEPSTMGGAAAQLEAQALAERVQCIDAASVRICERDMPYFDLGGVRPGAAASEREQIIVGSNFWLSNTTQVVLDGWANELTLSTISPMVMSATTSSVAPANLQALLWLCVAMATIATVLVYSRWINYPATPNLGGVLWHMFNARSTQWLGDYRLTLNFIALAGTAFGTTLVVALVYGYLPPLVGDGPWWQMLVLSLLVYSLVQTAIAFATILGDSSCRPPSTEGHFTDDRPTTVPIIWLRHLAQGTAALGFAASAIVPLSYDGSTSAILILLFLLCPYTLALIYHHVYYGIGLLALVTSKAHRGGSLWVTIGAGFEFLLMAGLVAVVVIFYLAGVVDSTSPFFAESWNFLLAVTLTALVVVAPGLCLMGEDRLVLLKVGTAGRKKGD